MRNVVLVAMWLAVAGAAAAEEVALPCDLPVAAAVDTPTDTDLFAFDVVDGEVVAVTVSGLGAFWGKPEWRLLDGSGSAASACGSFTLLQHQDCGPLTAASGPYRVQVRDFLQNDTGGYHVHLQRLTPSVACDNTSAQCDVSVDGAVDDVVDSDLFWFDVSDATTVTVGVTGVDAFWGKPEWRLVDGLGEPASACGSFTLAQQLDCGPLAAASGPFRLQVRDQLENDTGFYQVNVTAIAGACLPGGLLFEDRFETGDTSRWSSAAP